MADYIEREALLEAIDKAFDESPIEETTAWMLGRRIVKNFPAADVEEVKHGKIIKTGRRYPYCLECKCNVSDVFYRCPWCGAKFDEKEIDE